MSDALNKVMEQVAAAHDQHEREFWQALCAFERLAPEEQLEAMRRGYQAMVATPLKSSITYSTAPFWRSKP